MIPFLLATVFNCTEAQDLIQSVKQSRVEEKQEVINVIKLNTTTGCYEGSEHNS